MSLLVDQWIPEGTWSQVLRSTSVYSKRFESIQIFRVKIDWDCNFREFITPSILASVCFGTFGISLSNFWKYPVWLRIIDEGSVPELLIWSIILIKFYLKWCIHLSRSLLLYFDMINVLFWGPCEFHRSFSGRDISGNVFNRLLWSSMVDTEILLNNISPPPLHLPNVTRHSGAWPYAGKTSL